MKGNSQKNRFIGVGLINTCLDFGILFLLKSLGVPVLTANILSTTTAFCFSFFANKKYTFKTTDTNIKREIFLFVLVTLFGLWVLQTLAIDIVVMLIRDLHLPSNISLLIAKICATTVSLIWNYALYSRVVFKTTDGTRLPLE